MKLKFGNVILNQRALVRIGFIFFLIGIEIGAKIVIRDDYKEVSLLPFMPVFVLVIIWLCRSIRKEIDSERL